MSVEQVEASSVSVGRAGDTIAEATQKAPRLSVLYRTRTSISQGVPIVAAAKLRADILANTIGAKCPALVPSIYRRNACEVTLLGDSCMHTLN